MLNVKKTKKALVLGSECPIGRVVCSCLHSDYEIMRHGIEDRNVMNYYQLNLTDEKQIIKNIKHFGQIDLLISCVGGNKGFMNKKIYNNNLDENDINWIFNLNFFSNVKFCSKIIEQNSDNIENIIFFGSGVVRKYFDNLMYYSCAKAALHEYVFQLSRLHPKININCISPHPKNQITHENIETNEWSNKIKQKIIEILNNKITGEVFFI